MYLFHQYKHNSIIDWSLIQNIDLMLCLKYIIDLFTTTTHYIDLQFINLKV